MPNTESNEADIPDEIQRLFDAKSARRLEMARLPIEEKIRIIVEMQRIACQLREARGESPAEPWHVPWEGIL